MRRSSLVPDPLPMRRAPRARLCAVALGVTASFAASSASALSLGTPELASYLGQPLQLRVPAVLDDPSDTAGQCTRIINQPGSEVPTLNVGRIEVDQTVIGSFLRVTTNQPIDEPVLRVVLEIGCTQRVRREFTLLLDPPPVVAAVETSAPQAIDFGAPEVIGQRGQPLLVNVPISGEYARALSSACVNTGRSDSAETPRVLNDARVELIDRDGARSLRIHTPDAVNDARVRVIVELGCERPLRREFTVQLEAPRLAATPSEPVAAAAPATVPAPVKKAAKPVARVQPPPPPAPPPAPPVLPVTPPPAKLEPLAEKHAEVKPIEPARLPPKEPTKQVDRLVLEAPEDMPRQGPSDRELEVLKRVDELSAEVKKLRAELDASAVRNRELSEKANSANYAWAAAAVAALLLGLGVILGWRNRPRTEDLRSDRDRAGPMTRILGKSVEEKRPTPPNALMTDGAGPNTLAAIHAAHRAHEQDTQGKATAIQVTEFRDTTQVIGELYSPYIEKPANTRPGPATIPGGPQTKTEIALDLDLGQERNTTLSPQTVSPSTLSPQTKTEIAVDIDVFERNSQIGRDLQKEYEKLAFSAGSKPPAPKDEDPDPATLLGGTTMPMTTKLALDLDLDLASVQPKPPKKPEE